jgi:hypothetical protein
MIHKRISDIPSLAAEAVRRIHENNIAIRNHHKVEQVLLGIDRAIHEWSDEERRVIVVAVVDACLIQGIPMDASNCQGPRPGVGPSRQSQAPPPQLLRNPRQAYPLLA